MRKAAQPRKALRAYNRYNRPDLRGFDGQRQLMRPPATNPADGLACEDERSAGRRVVVARNQEGRHVTLTSGLGEAPPGFEPGMTDLQWERDVL
jgi:hypothetical protein